MVLALVSNLDQICGFDIEGVVEWLRQEYRPIKLTHDCLVGRDKAA